MDDRAALHDGEGPAEGFAAKVKADLKAFAVRDKVAPGLGFCLRMFLLTPGFQFVFSRRLQEVSLRIPLIGRLIRRILWWASCSWFSSELAMGATIGGGLYVPHPYGIVVGAARLGRNVVLMQNITIGRRAEDDPRDPRIEDGAAISAGAVVLGPVTIGRDAVIGANSVVLTSVPDGAVAVGAPARILERRRQDLPGVPA